MMSEEHPADAAAAGRLGPWKLQEPSHSSLQPHSSSWQLSSASRCD